jgi:hypothetical protein
VAKSDALSQLKEIHLPSPINWWPLAPGWYFVILLLLIVIISLIYVVNKKRLNALAKNQALDLLEIYNEHYKKDKNAQLLIARISELLRRVALVYYPRVEVASLHGVAWLEFLNKTGKGIDFQPVKSILLDSPFKVEETVNPLPLSSRAKQWIKQRRVPCSN